MGKPALCISTEDILPHIGDLSNMALYTIPDALLSGWGMSTILLDRDICETDESYLQLLPYITLMNRGGEIFTYERGGKGGEARLHGNLSVGLGGHVDELPHPHTLLQRLQLEAQRECEEEAKVKLQRPPEFNHMLFDGTNAVGRVHLGLWAIAPFDHSQLLVLEEGMIENGRWESPARLLQPDMFQRLENWSKLVVGYLGQP